VLVVEGDPVRRQIIAEQLGLWMSGSSAVVGHDEAIEALYRAQVEGKAFAVALMPQKSERDTNLRQAIQSHEKLRDTKLVLVADMDDHAELEVIAKAGFAARVHRPFTQSRLMDAIASATVERPDKRSLAAAEPAQKRSQLLAGLHLLVAEDNEMNQFVTEETLRMVGCTCDIVADGVLAVQAVGNKRYDAVLMDCQMPTMDGLEATRRIRANEAAVPCARRLPIIALTADAIQGDREKCLEAGMDGYVSKPTNAEDLFAAISGLVEHEMPASAD
jgi:hypothetical protein